MKTISTLLLLIVISLNVHANDSKYITTMKSTIEKLYASNSIQEYQEAINALQRIGNVEKDKWEPQYYIAFGYLMIANRESDATMKDTYLDEAMAAVVKAKKLLAEDSEIITLEGFVQMIRLTVDPASRGQKYSQLATAAFAKAVALNPENPRALAMLSQMQFGTAKFFGSATTDACNTNTKALEKFNTYKSENPIAPAWGKSTAEEMAKACQ